MKIKSVCEATGLTDRTVRYYIEEELISPAFTENYLGRKSFDFSQSDIQQLNDIAVLRKFGFSIAEIKEMLLYPAQIIRIVKALQRRKQSAINLEHVRLQALSRLDSDCSYTVTELAAQLSAPVTNDPLPAEDLMINIRRILVSFVKTLLLGLAVWLPVALSVLTVIDGLRCRRYPKVDPINIAIVLISLLPTFLMVLLPKNKARFHRVPVVRRVLTVLCVLSIPVSSFFSLGIITRSETSDIRNYRRLDDDCLANRDPVFQELFPTWPHYFINEPQSDGSRKTVYADSHYYYRNLPAIDHTYDIYAEWPVEKEEFGKEVSRVRALFEEQTGDFVTVQKGSYTCLFLYDGNPPFEAVTDSYTYYIFAFDEKNLTVRYITCSSLENGADQPYYLLLNWQ